MLKLVGNIEQLKKLVSYYGDVPVAVIISSNLTPNQQRQLGLIGRK